MTENQYDLLIVGGGIYGACVAWEGVLRGLSVAILEKEDFGSGTSANSLKIIHGGLRYLQHADFKRMRESICERTTLMRIAPHVVHPLPVVIPTYGYGLQGKEVMALALFANDLVSFDRNCLDDPQKYIPAGRVISRGEMMQLLPGIDPHGLTGGAIFYDAQVYNSERLVLSFLRSAEKAGAVLANYVAVTNFLKDKNHVIGVETLDLLTGERFALRAKMVVNTSGPWVNHLSGLLGKSAPNKTIQFAKAINVVTRSLFQGYAVGISGKQGYRDTDSVINKGKRLFFIAPWRGHSLIGTAYAPFNGHPDDFKIDEKEIQRFLDEINQACPFAGITMKDVSFVHGGLLPSRDLSRQTGGVQLAKHYEIHDHRQEGVSGLISVVGVKYTTARHVAEKVIDRVFECWEKKSPKSTSAVTPLRDGRIDRFDAFLHAEIEKKSPQLEEKDVRRLIYNYGSSYPEVLRHLEGFPRGREQGTDRFALLKAEVLYGVRDEMALKLSDIVLRRTEWGTTGHPGNEVLRICAYTMKEELGWSSVRTQEELDEVNKRYSLTHSVSRNGTTLAGSTVR